MVQLLIYQKNTQKRSVLLNDCWCFRVTFSSSAHVIVEKIKVLLTFPQGLKMSFNKVKRINKETFKGLNSLQRLHMDHNHIEFINPEAFYGLTDLQLVHLEGNHLQQIHPDTFITLRHSQVFKVSSVRSIHLSDNLLTTLPANIFTGCSQLENLFLHGNPWTCDCRMEWFSAWAHRHTGEKSELILNVEMKMILVRLVCPAHNVKTNHCPL